MSNRTSLDRPFAPLLSLLGALLCLLGTGCTGAGETADGMTADERFRRGMAEFQDEDYVEARKEFEIISLQFPLSEHADDAQYYLAESYFLDGDYKLAAFNYNRLQTLFPSSPFVKQAMFRSGESYHRSAPTFDRDQRDTEYAIQVFSAFASIYAADSLADTARARVTELRNKLARKDFMTAEQYWRMEEYKAALLYYERVVERYADTEYFQPATLGKIRSLHQLNRTSEALDAANKFLDNNPSGGGGQIKQLQMELSR